MNDELDILREVGNIAAAHGSIALSQLLGKKINLSLPVVDVVSRAAASEKANEGKLGMAVIVRLVTGLKGEAVFMLEEKNAFKLVGLSCSINEEEKNSSVLTELGISTIKEIGNIVTGAYLGAIGMMLKKVILTFPPTLISGTINEVLSLILSASSADDSALLIEAVFEDEEDKIGGGFYLVLSHESADDIRQSCKQMLRDEQK